MTAKASPGKLRVLLEFYREDQPQLFDELMRFPKGTRRVNRLRFLAQDGLVAHELRSGAPAVMTAVPLPLAPVEVERAQASLTDIVFDQGANP